MARSMKLCTNLVSLVHSNYLNNFFWKFVYCALNIYSFCFSLPLFILSKMALPRWVWSKSMPHLYDIGGGGVQIHTVSLLHSLDPSCLHSNRHSQFWQLLKPMVSDLTVSSLRTLWSSLLTWVVLSPDCY